MALAQVTPHKVAALRRSKTFATAVLFTFLFLIMWHQEAYPRPSSSLWRPPDSWRSMLENRPSEGGELSFGQDDNQGLPHSQSPWDPHKLPSANSFLAHFDNVTSLEGITAAEAQAGCKWPRTRKANVFFDPSEPEVDPTDEEVALRRHQWRTFINMRLIPYDAVKSRFNGQGIVLVAAGHPNAFTRVKVILAQLRRMKSAIAVEVHYLSHQIETQQRSALAEIYKHLHFANISHEQNILQVKDNNTVFQGYLRAAALINSRFAEPLLLDLDNLPIVDPLILYNSKVYHDYGTVFWPALSRTRASNPLWAISNTRCRPDEPAQDAAQLMVDKTRYFYHLQLSAWLAGRVGQGHGAYFTSFLRGGEDAFRFAWHALQTEYGTPKAGLVGMGTSDGGFCGHSIGQRFPDGGRVVFVHDSGLVTPEARAEAMRKGRDKNGHIHYLGKGKSPKKRGGFLARYKEVSLGEKGLGVRIRLDRWGNPKCFDVPTAKTGVLEDILPGLERDMKDVGAFWRIGAH